MAAVIEGLKVSPQTVASATSTMGQSGTKDPSKVSGDQFPSGDKLIAALNLYWDGTINQAGAADGALVTDGHLKNLRNVKIFSDKHLELVNADGLGLHYIQAFKDSTRPFHSALASNADNGTFAGSLRIDFADLRYFRPYDSILDMKKSRLEAELTFGNYVDFLTGANAANNVDDLIYDWSIDVANGPVKPEELPQFIPHLVQKHVAITTTSTQQEIVIPAGDRILRALYIKQANESTLNALNNTVLQADDYVSLWADDYPLLRPTKWIELQAKTKARMGIETLPTGFAAIPFDLEGRIASMPDLRKAARCLLKVDGRSVTNGSLDVYIDSFKEIPKAADRTSQES